MLSMWWYFVELHLFENKKINKNIFQKISIQNFNFNLQLKKKIMKRPGKISGIFCMLLRGIDNNVFERNRAYCHILYKVLVTYVENLNIFLSNFNQFLFQYYLKLYCANFICDLAIITTTYYYLYTIVKLNNLYKIRK